MSTSARLSPCAFALLATVTACAEVPLDEPASLAAPHAALPASAEATVEDLVDVLAPDFDLGGFLDELAKECVGNMCHQFCDITEH